MKANIEVICYKYKPLKDGTLPLMLRVTKDRKRKYVSLGLSLHEKFWDFEKGKPKRNCPSNVNTRWKRSCPIFITKSVALRWSNCTIN